MDDVGLLHIIIPICGVPTLHFLELLELQELHKYFMMSSICSQQSMITTLIRKKVWVTCNLIITQWNLIMEDEC